MRKVDKIYRKIEKANQDLNKIRKDCQHKETYIVENYCTRPGSFHKAELCKECDEVINWPNY